MSPQLTAPIMAIVSAIQSRHLLFISHTSIRIFMKPFLRAVSFIFPGHEKNMPPVFYRHLKKYKKNQWHVAFSLMGISMPFLVTAVGVVVSLLVRPIFVSRYILPALACFWFGCLVACEVCKRKKLIVCFCCMLVMTASYNYVRFIRSEHNGQIQSERLTQLLQTDHNAVFLSSALRMSNILREMSETEISMWGGVRNLFRNKAGIWKTAKLLFCGRVVYAF